jgi:hypothetical protein
MILKRVAPDTTLQASSARMTKGHVRSLSQLSGGLTWGRGCGGDDVGQTRAASKGEAIASRPARQKAARSRYKEVP